MAETPTIMATQVLIKKRAEVAGEIEKAEDLLRQLRSDLIHIDATLRLFNAEIDPEEIRAIRRRRKFQGFAINELPRRILDYLRTHGKTDTPSLVRGIMLEVGIDPDDRMLYLDLAIKVRGSAAKLRKNGLIASTDQRKRGEHVSWEIVSEA